MAINERCAELPQTHSTEARLGSSLNFRGIRNMDLIGRLVQVGLFQSNQLTDWQESGTRGRTIGRHGYER